MWETKTLEKDTERDENLYLVLKKKKKNNMNDYVLQ